MTLPTWPAPLFSPPLCVSASCLSVCNMQCCLSGGKEKHSEYRRFFFSLFGRLNCFFLFFFVTSSFTLSHPSIGFRQSFKSKGRTNGGFSIFSTLETTCFLIIGHRSKRNIRRPWSDINKKRISTKRLRKGCEGARNRFCIEPWGSQNFVWKRNKRRVVKKRLGQTMHL